MRTVGILNSYNLPGLLGKWTDRIRAFVKALGAGGFRKGKELELQLVDSDQPELIEAAARRFASQGVDLIHAIGTPNAVAAANATSETPIVYYGAHPEGIGDCACKAANVTGSILTLPLTADISRFSLVAKLVPRARVVWAPFFDGTVFVRPEMRAIHRAAAAQAGRRLWLRGSHEAVGFEAIAALARSIGIEYRERVYCDVGELNDALGEVTPRDSVLMPFNDSFYCAGAVERIIQDALERRLPVIWNNNIHMASLGILAGIGADFAAAGQRSGEIASAILSGAHPTDYPRVIDDTQVAWLNTDAARDLGLELTQDVLACFNRTVTGRTPFTLA